ncbi:hypothetical protein JRO89_XS05G0124500 [Xanthoceras sorbifolium]|uniref:Uncharacterized protein n=1 Tax=Xanthoceras sorbifolium TaxID=99658 RepID=A0ABQ8I1Q7_9ROSI|nr:hypothetical protein JRO89_XS05G0124500 [Xanthoceras sorbifolium]
MMKTILCVQGSHSICSNLLSYAQLLQIVQRQLTQLLMESVMILHEKERMLREEKENLEREIAAVKNGNDSTVAAMATLCLLR